VFIPTNSYPDSFDAIAGVNILENPDSSLNNPKNLLDSMKI